MTPGVGKALFTTVDALDDLGLRYAVVGGLAVGAWGVNRSTKDVDLYAELPETSHAALQRAMEDGGFHVPAGHTLPRRLRGCARAAGARLQAGPRHDAPLPGSRGLRPPRDGQGHTWPRRWRGRARAAGARLQAGPGPDAPSPGSKGVWRRLVAFAPARWPPAICSLHARARRRERRGDPRERGPRSPRSPRRRVRPLEARGSAAIPAPHASGTIRGKEPPRRRA